MWNIEQNTKKIKLFKHTREILSHSTSWRRSASESAAKYWGGTAKTCRPSEYSKYSGQPSCKCTLIFWLKKACRNPDESQHKGVIRNYLLTRLIVGSSECSTYSTSLFFVLIETIVVQNDESLFLRNRGRHWTKSIHKTYHILQHVPLHLLLHNSLLHPCFIVISKCRERRKPWRQVVARLEVETVASISLRIEKLLFSKTRKIREKKSFWNRTVIRWINI